MQRDLTVTNGDVSLAGTMWLPDGPGPHPAVVMVGGSGPTDRHNDVLFPPIREHLLGAGLAVFSYDKRGVGGSTGNWLAASYDDLAGDAAAAVALVRDQPDVEAGAVGLFGHSEGGWVVLRAAAAADPVYVVTNSGCGVPLLQQDRWATAVNLRAGGASEAEVAESEAVHERIAAWLAEGAAFTDIAETVRADPGYQRIIATGPALTEDIWDFLGLVHAHDPYPDLLALRCPHLALFGGAEMVVPVPASVTAFATASCERRGARDAELSVVVFPDADHRLSVGEGFAPGYLTTLTEWVSTRSGQAVSAARSPVKPG